MSGTVTPVIFASKVLSYLIYPLSAGLLVALVGMCVCIRHQRIGLSMILVGVMLIWVPSTRPVSYWLRGSLERSYPPRQVNEIPQTEVIVVLGGGLGPAIPPRLYPDLESGADRVMYAAQLYRAGKAPLVVPSGGYLDWYTTGQSEAESMKTVLEGQGVPASAILQERNSRTTEENAQCVMALLEERGLGTILLVTSALHMRRAHKAFRSVGLDVVPAATDYEVVDEGDRTWLRWLPSVGHLEGSTRAIKEYVGYWVYALKRRTTAGACTQKNE